MAGAVRLATLAVLALLGLALALALARRRPALASGSLLQHVEELRRRLLVVAAVLVTVLVACLSFRIELRGDWPLPVPSLYETVASQVFAAAADHLLPPGVQLVVTGPADGFVAQLSMAFGLALAVALPVAVDQLARFLAPALRPSERRWLAWAVLPAVVLFLLGAAFGFVVLLPVTFAALYEFSDALGAASLLSVADFAGFTLAFLAGCGLAFELPLVMALLARGGVVAPRTFWKRWRHALVVVLVVAMVVTPDPTIVSQLLLAAPLMALYVLGAALASRLAPSGSA